MSGRSDNPPYAPIKDEPPPYSASEGLAKDIDLGTSYGTGTRAAPPYPGSTGYGYHTEMPGAQVPAYTTVDPTQMDPTASSYDDAEGGGFSSEASFSDQHVRHAFIRKVYLILMVQLLVTFSFVCLFVFSEPVCTYVQNNLGIYLASYAVFLVTFIALACCNDLRRKFPANLILLGVFTLSLSYMVGTISSQYETKSVLAALGICAGVCLSVSIFSMQTKYDFTSCAGVLFACCMCLFFFGIFCIIFRSEILHVVYAGLGAILFTLFLAFDTQMIMGNRQYSISPEEYIFAALNLYIDIVYIFLFILSLLGGRNN